MNQMQLPKISKINKLFIIIFSSAFVFNFLLSKGFDINLKGLLGLSGGHFFSGYIYQLITYPLIPNGILEVVFNSLIIWFIGSELEEIWSRKRYLSFFAGSVIGGGLVYLIVSYLFFKGSTAFFFPLSGFSGFCSALCVAYGVLFPERTMFFFMFPLKAKWFVAIIVVMNLFQGLSAAGGALAWGQMGAMGFGFLTMMFMAKYPGLFEARDKVSIKRKKKVSAAHLKIVKDDDDGPRTYH